MKCPHSKLFVNRPPKFVGVMDLSDSMKGLHTLNIRMKAENGKLSNVEK